MGDLKELKRDEIQQGGTEEVNHPSSRISLCTCIHDELQYL